MKPGYRQSLGHLGESLAADFLKDQGYMIIGRNFRTPYGEIDLVAQIDEVIVFVEVKTRASKSLGPPEISITPKKQEHIRCAAEYYIQLHVELHNDWRIDVITIQIPKADSPPLIDHFQNAIS